MQKKDDVVSFRHKFAKIVGKVLEMVLPLVLLSQQPKEFYI